jgi:histidinol phosphatase-like PHP family hydrolase
MTNSMSRRELLAGAAFAATAPAGPDFAPVDYHCHLNRVITLDKALEISRQRGVKFGIVEHAGLRKDHARYAGLLADDAGVQRFLAMLEGKPVFKGIQAEGLNWMGCFSKEMIAKLDYVLTDALTIPGPGGKLIHIWTAESEEVIADKQKFMDRYTDFHVEIMATEPIDIIANPTLLPEKLMPEFDSLWTETRMRKIVDAGVKFKVAFEINSRYRLPKTPFLKMAKAAGARFSFGSNIQDLNIGNIDFSIETAKALGLAGRNMFAPAPAGKKPVEVRKG